MLRLNLGDYNLSSKIYFRNPMLKTYPCHPQKFGKFLRVPEVYTPPWKNIFCQGRIMTVTHFFRRLEKPTASEIWKVSEGPRDLYPPPGKICPPRGIPGDPPFFQKRGKTGFSHFSALPENLKKTPFFSVFFEKTPKNGPYCPLSKAD